jgi:hypothetical protein
MRPCALLAPVGFVLLASGCPSRDISSLGHGDNGEILNDVTVVTNRDVDVLFLIDNSSSMNDKQDLVASNFPRFIDVLRNIPGGLPNLHIGVASSSVSVGGYPFIDSCSGNFDDGLLQSTPRLCLASGQSCKVASSSDCCSGDCTCIKDSTGKCTALGMCSATRVRMGCHIPGESCSTDNDCCTHDCTAGTCGCPVPTGKYIDDEANASGGRTTNYGSAELEDVFTCIARLGVDGCGYEQHLEGVKRALDGSRSENAGFLRDNAYLAVVIVADEDDCSAKDTKVFDSGDLLGDATVLQLLGPSGSYRCTQFGVTCDGMDLGRGAAKDYMSCSPRTDSYLADPKTYVDFLRMLKGGDPTRVLVAVVAAPPTPFGVGICTDARGDFTCLKHSCMGVLNGKPNVGDPAVRLNAFEKQFGAQFGYFTNVCDNHYEMVLNDIGNLIAKVVGNSCLEGDIDVTDINPTEPGLQLQCEVSDAPNAGGTATEVVLPRCKMTDANTPDLTVTPCWWARTNAQICKTGTNTQIIVERNGAQPPVGTHVAARCATK